MVPAVLVREGSHLTLQVKPKAAVKIITKEEEGAGKRYMGGGEELVDGNGRRCTPKVGRLFFEVPGRPYAAHVWGDAVPTDQRTTFLMVADLLETCRVGGGCVAAAAAVKVPMRMPL